MTAEESRFDAMLRALISGAIGLSVAACATERSASPGARGGESASPQAVGRAPEPRVEPAKAASRAICPADEPHTRVAFEEVREGAALVLTTSEDIGDLRRRAAGLSLPDTLERSEPRLDNIHAGVRIVFEAEDGAEVSSLRHDVNEHARRIVDVCGLVLGPPHEPASGPAQPLEPQKKSEPKRAKDDRGKPADAKKQNAVAGGSKADAKPKPKPELAPKAKPKEPAKPAEAPKPPAKELPKRKQPVPPLPGIPRQPLPPSPDAS